MSLYSDDYMRDMYHSALRKVTAVSRNDAHGILYRLIVLSILSHGYRLFVVGAGDGLIQKTSTVECRAWVEFEYMRYIRSQMDETPFPFEDVMYHSQCDSAWAKHPPIVSTCFAYA
jgi:hypothetical protein